MRLLEELVEVETMSVEVRIVGLLVRVRVGEVEDAVISEAEELCNSLGTRRGLEGQGAVFPCGDEPVGLKEENNQLDALRMGTMTLARLGAWTK